MKKTTTTTNWIQETVAAHDIRRVQILSSVIIVGVWNGWHHVRNAKALLAPRNYMIKVEGRPKDRGWGSVPHGRRLEISKFNASLPEPWSVSVVRERRVLILLDELLLAKRIAVARFSVELANEGILPHVSAIRSPVVVVNFGEIRSIVWGRSEHGAGLIQDPCRRIVHLIRATDREGNRIQKVPIEIGGQEVTRLEELLKGGKVSFFKKKKGNNCLFRTVSSALPWFDVSIWLICETPFSTAWTQVGSAEYENCQRYFQ